MEKIEITVPTSWADVSVAKYETLDFEDTIGLIAILCDMERDAVEHLSLKSSNQMLDLLDFVWQDPLMTFDTTIAGYKCIDNIDKLAIGDLELLENLCADFVKNASKIAAFVYRSGEDLTMNSIESRAKIIAPIMRTDQLFGIVFRSIVTAGLLSAPDIVKKYDKIDG